MKFTGCLLILLALCVGVAGADEKQPNIVVILADDLGLGDLGAYNAESKIPTPHMDRLATAGVRFTDAHSPSAVCTPTRYALLTGRYCWRSRLKRGVLTGYSGALIEPQRETIASMLKLHGYATACIGKWHLGLGNSDKKKPDMRPYDEQPFEAGPHTVGFDESYIIPASLDMAPYVYVRNGKLVEAATDRTAGSKRRWDGGGGFWRGGPAAPGFDFYQVLPTFEQKAVEYIAARKGQQEPFFLYMPLPAPHTPWMPLEEFRGKSKAGYYGDFVVQVDHTIGQVMKAVDEAGLADNTIFIVTSDNGSHWPDNQIQEFGHRGNGNVRGQKADIHEGGHRVPLLVRWPGEAQAGAASSALVGLNDLYGTFAEIAGHTIGDGEAEDSVSFLGVLAQPEQAPPSRESLINHSGNGMFAIRVGEWKLIAGLGSGGFTPPQAAKPQPDGPQGQLYNLAQDPREELNLWQEEPERVKQMTALLNEVRQ